MPISTRRVAAIVGAITLSSITLAACGSSSDSTSKAMPADGPVDLAAAGCPDKIVIQTDWNPEAEHGHLYEMLGKDAVIDAKKKSVTGTLMLNGKSTGVQVEIRAGGPAIGFQQPVSQMYTENDITMAYATTDDQINTYGTTPVKSFFAPLNHSPIMVMWDPATYPDADSVASIGADIQKKGGIWRYFAGSTYMDYLFKKGIVPQSSTDSSYDGTPAGFVAAGGKDVQQGFATAEPYEYENEITSWKKPVKYALVSTTGWDPYQSSMAVRTADFSKLSGCLKKFTPVLQQAEVNYFADPKAANDLILKLVKEYDTGWTYSQGTADYADSKMISDQIVSNGTDGAIGSFDDGRMSDFFTKAVDTFSTKGAKIDSKLTVKDLYTNEFIDPSIGLKK